MLHLVGRRAGLVDSAVHTGDIAAGLLGTHRGFLHVARNLLRRGGLLLHRRGDRRADGLDIDDRRRDVLDRRSGVARGVLNAVVLAMSAEHSVWQEGVRTGRSRWSP